MQLHRSEKQPDWHELGRNQYNVWQKVGAVTGGWLTPANVITLIGLAVVIVGLACVAHGQYWTGIGLLVAGRLCDVADGWIADRTATKGPVGEMLDAVIDKIGTVMTILVLLVSRTAPWWALLLLVLPQLLNSVLTAYSMYRHKRLHPSRVGKLSMAALWVSLVGLIVIRALHTTPHSFVEILVYSVLALSVVMGLTASKGYLGIQR